MLNIGAKIKELRKERKMTLAQVAGDRLTKGMLSLIENGKAQPSMESLHYIASQLQIDVAELIQSEDNKKIHDVFMQAEQLSSQLKKEYEKEQRELKERELLQLIEPFVQSNSLKGTSYEEVRLLEIYLVVRYRLKINRSVEPFLPLAKMYENVHAYSKMLSCFSLLCGIAFNTHHYEQALDYLLEGEKYIDRYYYLINDLEKLDFYYNLAAAYTALNNNQKTEEYFEIALKMAKEKKVLYRLNDFYRFLCYLHCSNGDAEKSYDYLTKMKAFSTVLEDPIDAISTQIMTLAYTNQIEKDFEKTLSIQIDYFDVPKDAFIDALLFTNGEYAYAHLQLKQYAQAKKLLENLFVSENQHHPLDLGISYRAFAVRALCYFEEGDIVNAKRDILYAMDGVKEFKNSFDKQFILQAYERITH
ncbi:helix-turn-helix domain-containing protein [Bacillus ndiopicus]|uniref:helix-turn-helix domain-containing protein n=1 Tax=Bacillus ndiopicus TaxID=1347368 RepID=UPI0005A9E522|nr:helix-turn-helix domain-containing protein [Bacillus ndiopicus]